MAMNLEILKATKALAELIRENAAYKAFEEAEKEYEANAEIANLMMEYNVQQIALTEEYKKAPADREEALTAAIQARINELYEAIMSNPAYEAYKRAGDEYEQFYNGVLTELNYMVTGKKPSCSGDCSSCGGCH